VVGEVNKQSNSVIPWPERFTLDNVICSNMIWIIKITLHNHQQRSETGLLEPGICWEHFKSQPKGQINANFILEDGL